MRGFCAMNVETREEYRGHTIEVCRVLTGARPFRVRSALERFWSFPSETLALSGFPERMPAIPQYFARCDLATDKCLLSAVQRVRSARRPALARTAQMRARRTKAVQLALNQSVAGSTPAEPT